MDTKQAQTLIDREIQRIGQQQPTPGLYLPIQYLLDHTRARPFAMLAMHTYALFREELEPAAPLAVGLELYYEFILMTEDLLRDRSRFGQHPAVHRRWDQNAVILSGDVMLIYSYQLIARSGLLDPEVLRRYTLACRAMVESLYLREVGPQSAEAMGAPLDTMATKRSLFGGLALELPARLAQANPRQQKHLHHLGKLLAGRFTCRS